MADSNPYKLLLLMAMHEMTTSTDTTSPLSYWALAGVHGLSWSYNGVSPPSSGFCRHARPDFGPWHRPYLLAFEQGLKAAARAVAGRFATPLLRDQYAYVAQQLRLPYYDWTSGTPPILTAATVTVLDAAGRTTYITNPLTNYRYTRSLGGSRSGSITHASNWASAMSASAGRLAAAAASFVQSGSWQCSYMNSARCAANLEGFHNDIHNILGGASGEMA